MDEQTDDDASDSSVDGCYLFSLLFKEKTIFHKDSNIDGDKKGKPKGKASGRKATNQSPENSQIPGKKSLGKSLWF